MELFNKEGHLTDEGPAGRCGHADEMGRLEARSI